MSLYSVDNIKEKLVISLYAKGMSVSDIEEEMREIYEIELSTSAISIILNILAVRAIGRDEVMVKAADRLR